MAVVLKSFIFQGHPRLINALAPVYERLLGRQSPLDVNKEILVTDGAYEALFTAIMGLVNPGDEVIIMEPYFDCYEPMVRLAGGIPRFIALSPVKKVQVFSIGTKYTWTLSLTRRKRRVKFIPQTGSIVPLNWNLSSTRRPRP